MAVRVVQVSVTGISQRAIDVDVDIGVCASTAHIARENADLVRDELAGLLHALAGGRELADNLLVSLSHRQPLLALKEVLVAVARRAQRN